MSKDNQDAAHEGLLRFIGLTFRSVWSLELLSLLRTCPGAGWTRDQMIESLRASEQVLSRSIEDHCSYFGRLNGGRLLCAAAWKLTTLAS